MGGYSSSILFERWLIGSSLILSNFFSEIPLDAVLEFYHYGRFVYDANLDYSYPIFIIII